LTVLTWTGKIGTNYGDSDQGFTIEKGKSDKGKGKGKGKGEKERDSGDHRVGRR